MLHFNTESWHYRLVLYVFGKNFFLDSQIDFDALQRIDSTKLEKLSYNEFPRKYTAKVVNFCPYCRGVLWSALSLPFVFLWRLFPHKQAEERTHEEVMKRMKRRGFLIRCIAGGVQFPFALMNYLGGNYYIAIFQVILGVVIIVAFTVLPGNKFAKKIFYPVGRAFLKIYEFVAKFFKKEKKVLVPPKTKNPSLLREYLHEKHSVICPPVCFIAKVDQENLR